MSQFHNLKIVSAVIDAAKNSAARPFTEFFLWPRLPIREVYQHRFLINLVWFARNYLNVVLISAVVASYWHPWFITCLLAALQIHLNQGRHVRVRAWKAVQLVACIWCGYLYGVVIPFTVAAAPMVPIAFHALFTPYTDEASTHYESVLEQIGEEVEGPRTPVQPFEATKTSAFAETDVNDDVERSPVDPVTLYGPSVTPPQQFEKLRRNASSESIGTYSDSEGRTGSSSICDTSAAPTKSPVPKRCQDDADLCYAQSYDASKLTRRRVPSLSLQTAGNCNPKEGDQIASVDT